MKKLTYYIALLLFLCLCGCNGEQGGAPATTATTPAETTATAASEITAETAETEIMTLETTTAAAETTVTETAAETTAETTTAITDEVTTAPETTAPEESKFLPTVLLGNYTYNSGSDPVIEVVDGVTYVNGILIANKTYSLPEDFNPGGLHPDAQAAFDEMQAAAAAEGITLKIISGYRSYTQQTKTYATYAARDGEDAADRYSARPGHSEHQTGLAMDINSLWQSFADTAEGKWLAEHCAEYGFIIRYGADKETETGFMYEPWHIRYLGLDWAKAVTESGLCLEEYLGITSAYVE